ncbi:segregation/condensation protein A [Vagococcus lutrae]|uniref:Segregation and condensation protein A n=2 Tax=Vagococcus lutrae TaxID=81947 RepID=V6Q7A4_9ENTE|nr:segregation/condensation protein A [Vagococcus lutrae]EST90652.1 hypothetical protein T233_00190 [Vagococcus lutrae LBD1]MDT2806580.1 segregation/condensation protein A [Vagococcus lutrae]MDT2824770.1 segregation/condensation protein A [Vagococcus lutrae]NKZ28167.1 segregation/condensation protein A [Vagococcus lutrae]UQF19136.1 segregation/condensation protein A [Vagococcus lutrae]
MSEELKVKLDVFEGPLDLLLHLIQTLEIDIYDIPIAEITTQYMNYIDTMTILQLDVAGDYIVMAATLMSIKSQMLLPIEDVTHDDLEMDYEVEDPREALVQQLLEYKKYKVAATVLHEKEAERQHYFSRPPTNLDDFKEEVPPLEPNQVNTLDLFLAFHDMIERQKKRLPRHTTVQSENRTIEEQMTRVLEKVKTASASEAVRFDDLFDVFTRPEIVTTFMAVLELIKTKEIVVRQSEAFQPIYVFQHSENEETELRSEIDDTAR